MTESDRIEPGMIEVRAITDTGKGKGKGKGKTLARSHSGRPGVTRRVVGDAYSEEDELLYVKLEMPPGQQRVRTVVLAEPEQTVVQVREGLEGTFGPVGRVIPARASVTVWADYDEVTGLLVGLEVIGLPAMLADTNPEMRSS